MRHTASKIAYRIIKLENVIRQRVLSIHFSTANKAEIYQSIFTLMQRNCQTKLKN